MKFIISIVLMMVLVSPVYAQKTIKDYAHGGIIKTHIAPRGQILTIDTSKPLTQFLVTTFCSTMAINVYNAFDMRVRGASPKELYDFVSEITDSTDLKKEISDGLFELTVLDEKTLIKWEAIQNEIKLDLFNDCVSANSVLLEQ